MGARAENTPCLLARVSRGDIEDALDAVRIEPRKVARRANAADENAGAVLIAVDLVDCWVRGRRLRAETRPSLCHEDACGVRAQCCRP